MENNQALAILKAFYFGAPDMATIAAKTKATRDEVREVLRGARSCGLIEYNTIDQRESFNHVKQKKLGAYLRTKGAIK